MVNLVFVVERKMDYLCFINFYVKLFFVFLVIFCLNWKGNNKRFFYEFNCLDLYIYYL